MIVLSYSVIKNRFQKLNRLPYNTLNFVKNNNPKIYILCQL